MHYVEGFVLAVPEANKEIYREHAVDAFELVRDFGVERMVETWGDDVPDGKLTDFRRAVKAEPGETVVFSWFEYPSKEARDAANERMMADPRMEEMAKTMPFDGKRMIYGGFASIMDERTEGAMGYVDGILVPVPRANREAYLDMARTAAAMFHENGATRVTENWGDDLPEGKVTDYRGAVRATEDEVVVFSWVEWPSKAVRDMGWAKIMASEGMPANEMPFDGKRMVYGGFAPLLDL